MRLGRLALIVVAFIAAVPVSLAIIGVWSTFSARRHAEEVLLEVKSLDMRKATFQDVRRLIERLGGGVSKDSPQCSSDACSFTIIVTNSWVYRLVMLAPPMALKASVEIAEGRVRSREVGLYNVSVKHDQISAEVVEFACKSCIPGNEDVSSVNSVLRDERHKPIEVLVYCDAREPQAARQQFNGFNLDCLTRIGGCDDPYEMLPSAKR